MYHALISNSLRFLLLAGVVLSAAGVAAAATFDDLTLASESYWNGSDESGGFLSGDSWFTNTYIGDWSYWESFAYSNRTDTDSIGMNGQYTAYSANGAGGGAGGSDNYGVGYVGGFFSATEVYVGYATGDYDQYVEGAYFTNNAYAYDSMLNGDGYAKKFGGESGDDEDWFKLTITGLNANYEANGVSVVFYLADFRDADNSEDYIVKDWTYVDLTSLGKVYGLQFSLSSSDVGGGGMNTPAYFAIDNLQFNPVPEPGTIVLALTALAACVACRLRRGRKS